MVYLTGDTHNEFTRLSNKYFKKYDLEIGENDYIIVCGDLGLCWSKESMLNRYSTDIYLEVRLSIILRIYLENKKSLQIK